MAERLNHDEFPGLQLSDVVLTKTVLGKGADAIVLLAEWDGQTCAAKRLHEVLLEDQSLGGADRLISNFKEESFTWSKLSHPAVVQFFGVYLAPRSRLPVLVMEKMDISLRRYLEEHSKEDFPFHLKVYVLRQVTQALAYLHAQKPPLVHHDLSPNNVLLNRESFVTKVTDFGMSRAVNPSIFGRKSSVKGTQAFMSPEALQEYPQYNETLDIFSFGNIILTTLTHKWPNPDQPTYTRGFWTVGRSELQRREKYCEMLTVDEKKCFLPIVTQCLENKPSKRPLSNVLVEKLQHIEATRCVYTCKVILLGDTVVGKSNLISLFTRNEFQERPPTTIVADVCFRNITIDSAVNVKVEIWDTAGQERFRSITRSFFRRAVGALLVYDITCRQSFSTAEWWLTELRKNADSNITIMLVGNKCDMSDFRAVSTATAKDYAESNSMLFIETSAKDGTNVEAAFHGLVTEISRKGHLKLSKDPAASRSDPSSPSHSGRNCCS